MVGNTKVQERKMVQGTHLAKGLKGLFKWIDGFYQLYRRRFFFKDKVDVQVTKQETLTMCLQ